MPGKVKVKILSGRNLPVMDRSSDTTDAYVEIKLGNTTHKTEVCRKSLNPTWDSEWYRYEVDDSELQDEPLQIRLMDHDTYSANDSIGKVYLDLNPLLLPSTPGIGKITSSTEGAPPSNTSMTGGSVLSGWIPVFDTMHGIRGEVNIIVKVELFSDFNKFRQSSCGVQFFCSPVIPQGYHAQVVHGFVEELVVNDDPEYQWIDKIRTPRASNEARQTLFLKLSGEVQRKIGLKALDLGGNAVIGYHQCFDLEGESGIVVRGIGTAVTLMKLQEMVVQSSLPLDSATPEDGMVLADASVLNSGFVDGSGSGLQPLMLCVVPPTPRLCVLPPSRDASPCPPPPVSPSGERLLPPKLGPAFCKPLKGKKGKKHKVKVHPAYLSAGCTVQIPASHRYWPTPDYVRHFSQPTSDQLSLSSGSARTLGRSAQSLGCTSNDEITVRLMLEQEEMRAEARGGNRLARSLRAMRFLPHGKLTKKLAAFKAKFHSNSSVDEDSEQDSSSISEWSDKGHRARSGSDAQKSKLKFQKKHKRSSSDTVAATLIRSLIENNSSGLDSVVEVRESPGSSPTSPSRRESYVGEDFTPVCANNNVNTVVAAARSAFLPSNMEMDLSESYLRLPTSEDGPELRYVDGHLISNTSSGISSSSDSSSTDEDASEDFSLGAKSKEKTPPLHPVVSPFIKSQCLDGSDSHINVSKKCATDVVTTCFYSNIKQGNKSCSAPAIVVGTNVDASVMNSTPDSDFINSPLAVSTPIDNFDIFNLNTDKQRLFNVSKNSVITPQVSSNKPCFQLELPARVGKVLHSGMSNDGATGMALNTADRIVPILAITATTPTDNTPDIETYFTDTQGGVIRHPSVNYFRSISLTEPGQKKTTPLLEEASVSDPNLNFSNRQFHQDDLASLSESDTMAQLPATCIAPRSSNPELVIPSPSTPCTCSMDVVTDVGGSCKTNSGKALSASAIGGGSGGLLIVPLSPLHKSKSATSLCSRPVEHATNYEDLQHHNVKHGPCLVPSSRQLLGEEPLPGSPPSAPVHPHAVGPAKISPSPAKLSSLPGIHRRSSDSDLSITPKGNSLTGSDRSSNMGGHIRQGASMIRPTMNQESLDMLEYPFLTMSKYPPGFILHLGGTVSSRSVKLLERITNLEEPETRDAWWTELRMEVRSHARALGCNVVLGYTENTSICDDVCVLSASGTAAVIGLQYTSEPDPTTLQHPLARVHQHSKELMTTSLDRTDFERDKATPQKGEASLPFVVGSKLRHPSDGMDLDAMTSCSLCHIPYSEASVPFRVTMLRCAVCRRGKVPDVLFTTIEPPDGIPTSGKGCFLQAYVCRPKRDCRGELNAKEISDGLPFLEYELHRLLIYKLKVKGMNTIFGLKVQVSIGEKMLIGLATGTAVFLTPLPTPPVPKVSAGNSWSDGKKLADVQKKIQEAVNTNRELYQLKGRLDAEFQSNGRLAVSDAEETWPGHQTEESDDELPDLDLATGNKDTCVFEIDDAEDMDVVSLVIDPQPPDGFHVVNMETVPGLDDLEIVRNLQMFTQVWRTKLPCHAPRELNRHFHRLLESVYFKLRRMVPCALCDLQFRVELPEPDEIQICVLGMALGLGELEKPSSKCKRKFVAQSSSREMIGKKDDSDLIFSLEDDHIETQGPAVSTAQTSKVARPRSPLRTRIQQVKPHHTPPRERHGVDITPLSYVPGGKIERYLGNLNFFFIRESTGIREGGGLSGFVHSFVTEVLAIVRAHVTALGGNAMVAYFMSECVLYHNQHKNQGQCLINVGGDVVFVSYFPEE